MDNQIVLEDLEGIHAALATKDKLRGSTVIMTGCAGFLGRYIIEYLTRYASKLGIRKVIGLDSFLLETPAWLAKLSASYPVLEVQRFDISHDDFAQIEALADADFVIHGASIASPPFYRKYPIETIDANIWGLRRLLDFFRTTRKLKGLLFFSSSEIYGDPTPDAIPTHEEYRGLVSCHGPRACYDESKRFGETLCWVYAQQYGMPITVARPFNNYGPGMRLGDQRLPADLAKWVIEGKDIVLLSDGTPTRTFCYVADAVKGYLLCLLHGSYDYFNIGIEKPEVMVRDLAEIFRTAGSAIFGYGGRMIYQKSDDDAYLVDNPNRRCPIIAKARSVLGYAPCIEVGEGVHRYLQFLKIEQGV